MLNRHAIHAKLLHRTSIILFAQMLLLVCGGAVFGAGVRALGDSPADQSGKWTVENNESVALGDGVMTIASDDWKDYTLRLRLITDEPGTNPWDTAAVRFRVQDEGNYYYAIIHKTGLLEFGKMMNGAKNANLATLETGVSVTKWNELRIALKGSLITIQLNGKEAIRFTDPTPLTSGGVALWSLGAGKCRFKDISASTSSGDIAWRTDAPKARQVIRRDAVGVYMGASPADAAIAGSAIKSLSGAGFTVVRVGPDDVVIREKITPQRFFLYVVPSSKRYPAAGLRVVQEYLKQRGNLMVMGGPAFSDPINKIAFGGTPARWYDLESFKRKVSEVEGTTDLAAYTRTLGQDGRKWALLQVGGDWKASEFEATGLKLVPGADGGVTKNCLAYSVERVSGWGTFSYGLPPGLIAADHDSLALWAKGDSNTAQILLELDEKDGSRWLRTLDVTDDWRYYEIPFSSFKYWTSVKSRGGAGDSFKGAAGDRVSVGLAMGHCRITPGAHRFWIDGLGFTASSLTKFQTNTRVVEPIETVYPAYKVYPVGKVTTASLDPRQSIITPGGGALAAPANALSPIARPKGQGYGGESPCRWIPLVNVYDGNEKRGTVASMTINKGGRFRDTICASLGVGTLDPGMSRVLRQIAVRIRDGLFLLEGGSEYSCYYPGETIKLGARVANLGGSDRGVKVQMKICAGTKVLWKSESSLTLQSGARDGIEKSWKLADTGSQPLVVKTTLLRDGRVIDNIQQELAVLPPRGQKPPADSFVSVSGGDFYLHGKKWYANGINYWPLYVNGHEDVSTWCSWLNPDFYVPDEIETDLTRLNKMGVNMVSIQMILGKDYNALTYPKASLRNLQDFLRRCANHSIKVNGYLMHSSPLCPVHSEYNKEFVASVLTEGDLANNNALFAYDLAWEASGWLSVTGKYKDWDKQWNDWIVERYGSVASAEQDWGFAPEHVDGLVASPTMAQLTYDPPASAGEKGNWLRYVAAYRRFADDFISREFRNGIRFMKQYDPNHLYSVRGSGGCYSATDFFLNGIAKHLDFISPEGYGIAADEQGFDVLGFQSRLVHSLCNKPVYIAEFGMSVWDEAAGRPDPLAEQRQGQYIENFHKRAVEAGLNGLAPWWYPGGYRTGESSDYGVVSPNGVLRPSAEAITKYAGRFTGSREYPADNEWMVIDRDAQASGYFGPAYHEGREAYAKAVAAGKHFGVKSPGAGTDSANAPLIAVGNVPYTGNNPPKYLDGEFNWVKIKSGDGEWLDVFSSGTVIKVVPGKPIYVRAGMGNIGEASWLAPSLHPGKGSVYVASRTGDIAFTEPILNDTPYMGDAETSEFVLSNGITKETPVVFELAALERMWFGEKFRIVLSPQ